MASPPSSASPPSRPLSLPLLPSSPSPHSPSLAPSPSPKPLLLTGPESKSSPRKKSPPLPWQHQETLALIQAYEEKWYSLKKGQLKAFQWEEVAVAVTVAARYAFDEPSRTSTQCRHKIEKLRKRYRSELQKPYPNSWQYFEPMDSMERGPLPLNARPIAVVKASPNNANNSDNSNNVSHNFGNLYSGSADYYNNIHGNCGRSDQSDEEWNVSYGVQAAKKNKSKSINNIVRGDVKSGPRSAKRVVMERGFNGGSARVARLLRNPVNGKRKQYYDGDDSDDDDGGDEDEDGMEEEELLVEEEIQGGGGRGLATEIRGFAEMFMRMENKKIEMMREAERYRMEMEKKRMEMILVAQRKIIDTLGTAFGAHKKAKMDQET